MINRFEAAQQGREVDVCLICTELCHKGHEMSVVQQTRKVCLTFIH
jgi:hypothetical protein